jgi:aminopeptidase N
MSRYSHHLALWFVVLAGTACPTVLGQNTAIPAKPAFVRQPFAKPGTSRQPERIRFFDVKHIKAELAIDAKRRDVSGTVTHTLSPLHPYLTSVELDCGTQLKVSKVTVGKNPTACKFSVKGEKLTVALDKPYRTADTVDLVIHYAGSPQQGLYFIVPEGADREKPLAFWTQGESEDTREWLPCYDYPNDRATSEMIIKVAKPLFVLSNGVLIKTTENADNTTTYHWKMDMPHSSYLISLAAQEFAVYHDRLGDLPVDYYVAKNVDEATARRFMGKTPRMIQFFGEKTGQPYPYPKYAQVCVPDFIAGGMENISATTMTDTALHDETADLEGDADGLVAHELAHQWFGDLLTCKDWSHIWLNEGFASYFDALFAEHDRGEDQFRLDMNASLQGYVGSDRGYRRPVVESRYRSADDMFDSVTYAKGACVLHTLRGLVGDAAWWKGIKGYVALNKVGVVDTDDFRRAMESASGKDLKWFFDQWAYKAGHPELKVRWRFEDADKTVRVQIEQTQKVDAETPLFRLPTTIEITGSDSKTSVIPIVIDAASQELVIPADAPPRMVQIDPLGWLIKEIDFVKSDEENRFQLEHAACVLGRLDAAQALMSTARDKPETAKALAGAWKREKSAASRRTMFNVLCNGDERFRATLVEGARDHDARIRVAAVAGLAALKHDDASEIILRSAWSNPKEAYGARKAALRGLAAWKVKDIDKLMADALKVSADRHTIAAVALGHLLDTPGTRARELAVLYTRSGQPQELRSMALGTLSRLAKEDPVLQDILVELADDSDRSVRTRAWMAVGELKLKKALPVLESRLARDHMGFAADTRQILERAISALKEQPDKPRSQASPAILKTKGIAALETQAAELELKAKELRNRIADLKRKIEAGGQSPPEAPATGGSTSTP